MDLAYDLAGGGGGGSGYAAAYYSGFNTSAILANSVTWADIATILTAVTDAAQVGVARAGSVWTFAEAGVYRASVAACFAAGTAGRNMLLRLRDVAGATTYLASEATANSNQFGIALLTGVFVVTAGKALTLQYVVSAGGSFGTFNAGATDGETNRTAHFAMERVG